MVERIQCTRYDPWTPDKGFPVSHVDAKEVGDQEDGWPGGDIVRMECPHCGVSWKKELPQ